MKKQLIFGLAFTMLLSMAAISSGCRGTIRARTLNPGDRSVTTVKKHKRSAIKGRHKPVVSRKYNRVRK
jgi:hypothetical protein